MELDESGPQNKRILRYLQRTRPTHAPAKPISSAGEHPDPYWKSGNHPEIVERVWDCFGALFASDCKAMVYGTPALVHPNSGVVFALAFGTQYAISVPESFMSAARSAGCQVTQQWTGGKFTDLAEAFGPGWVFGCWQDEEKAWVAARYEELSG